jgi:hypothetical protein
MKSIITIICAFLILQNNFVKGQDFNTKVKNYGIENEVKLIHCTDYILNNFGDSIWENISKTPLRILLVSDSLEFLFNHSKPSKDFKLFTYDPVLRTNIYIRNRIFPTYLLAAFPAVNSVDCIVVGSPNNVNRKDEDWIIALLHEHFHVYQGTSLLYKKTKKVLGKKFEKKCPNWMLDYNFPYNKESVINLFNKYSNLIYETYRTLDKKDLKKKINQYKLVEIEIQNSLTQDDYDYFIFQIWQEGIARYTEFRYLKLLNINKKYLKDVYSLDYTSKEKKLVNTCISRLLNNDLQSNKRHIFYSLGLLKGIINDKTYPKWQNSYFKSLKIK